MGWDTLSQSDYAPQSPTVLVIFSFFLLVFISIVRNVLSQIWFPDRKCPPMVFHMFPWIGSTIQYGMDPYAFFAKCQAIYGDCFTFVLLGRPHTVYLGPKGHKFILNGKHADLNAEDIYGKLTTPVFGKGVVYDCPNEVLMDQKRLVKEAFTTDALRSYIPIFVHEVEEYLRTSPNFQGQSGTCNISEVMSEILLYSAARSLQGKEVRDQFDGTYATLYRHLDDGFQPINFVAPWLPLPQNRRRDHARQTMEDLYSDMIRQRREKGAAARDSEEHDMLTTLVDARYKDGTLIPDIHVARLMIAMLMGGQHNTAASSAWVVLHLAHQPSVIDELWQEQLDVLGPNAELTLEGLEKLTHNKNVIKETLRLHSPIHSILRAVTQPMQIPETDWIVPPGHVLLSSPSYMARSESVFSDAMRWSPRRWETSEADKEDVSVTGPTVDYGFGVMSKSVSSPYLPFGAGRHRCVGEKYAYVQLGATLVTLVRLLKFEQVDPKADIPATDYSSMFSRPMNPAMVKWHRR